MIELTVTPNEESALSFSVIISDDDGIVPLSYLTSLRWQLSDIDGNIINGRDFSSGLITENPTVIFGDDLEIGENGTCRIIAIKAVYDSLLGLGITGTEEAKFSINDLVNIGQ